MFDLLSFWLVYWVFGFWIFFVCFLILKFSSWVIWFLLGYRCYRLLVYRSSRDVSPVEISPLLRTFELHAFTHLPFVKPYFYLFSFTPSLLHLRNAIISFSSSSQRLLLPRTTRRTRSRCPKTWVKWLRPSARRTTEAAGRKRSSR